MGCVWSGPHTKSPRTRKSRKGRALGVCMYPHVYRDTRVCMFAPTCLRVSMCTASLCVASACIRVRTSLFVCAVPSAHTRLSPSQVNPTKGKAKAKQNSWCALGRADNSKANDSSGPGIPQQGDATPLHWPAPLRSSSLGILLHRLVVAVHPREGRCVPWGGQPAAAPDGCSGEGQGQVHGPSTSPPPPCSRPTWLTSWER